MPRRKGELVLRWAQFDAVLAALETGHTAEQARLAARIPAVVWRRLRARWIVFELEAMLNAQDPDGVPVDLHRIDELIISTRTDAGGRPKGSTDRSPRVRSCRRKRTVLYRGPVTPPGGDLAEAFL